MAGDGPRIIVVGAGIIGASIAWHLSWRGAAVTIVEAGEPGGVATPNSFAWINSNYHFSENYFRLRHHSMSDWKRLAREVAGLPVSLRGSLYLPAKGLDLHDFVARNAAWGYRIELVDAARIADVEPNLRFRPDIGAHARDEGAAEPVGVAQCLVKACVTLGAQLRSNAPVDGLVVEGGEARGVSVGGDALSADAIVVAAGAGTPRLIAGTGFDVPLSTPPGLLVHTTSVSPVLNGVVLADGLHVRQKANGELVAGSDYQGSELAGNPESGGAELMRRLREVFDISQPLELQCTTTGLRPMPEDGMPIVGWVPGVQNVYVAVMHSGVTLCPAIGDFAAREIVEGERDPLLAPFGPERFLAATTAAHTG